jgi:hypothetical protein
VPGLLEEVRVGVESHARARVTEDAAHLDDVEPDIDDQVAGEGVTEIVEAQVAVAIETGVPGGAAEGVWRCCGAGTACPVPLRTHSRSRC